MLEYIGQHPIIGSVIVTFVAFCSITGLYIILRFASAAIFRSYFEAKNNHTPEKEMTHGKERKR